MYLYKQQINFNSLGLFVLLVFRDAEIDFNYS